MLTLLIACHSGGAGLTPPAETAGADSGPTDHDSADSGETGLPDTGGTSGTETGDSETGGSETGETDSTADLPSDDPFDVPALVFSSAWTNGSCPSFAPFDAPEGTWAYNREVSPTQWQYDNYGELLFYGGAVWQVTVSANYSGIGHTIRRYWVCEEDGLHLAATYETYSQHEYSFSEVVLYDPPPRYAPADLSVGTSWSDDYDTVTYFESNYNPEGEITYGSGTVDGEVVDEESVTVDAGTFDVVRVDAGDTSWYWAEGVGVVIEATAGDHADLRSYTITP